MIQKLLISQNMNHLFILNMWQHLTEVPHFFASNVGQKLQKRIHIYDFALSFWLFISRTDILHAKQ